MHYFSRAVWVLVTPVLIFLAACAPAEEKKTDAGVDQVAGKEPPKPELKKADKQLAFELTDEERALFAKYRQAAKDSKEKDLAPAFWEAMRGIWKRQPEFDTWTEKDFESYLKENKVMRDLLDVNLLVNCSLGSPDPIPILLSRVEESKDDAALVLHLPWLEKLHEAIKPLDSKAPLGTLRHRSLANSLERAIRSYMGKGKFLEMTEPQRQAWLKDLAAKLSGEPQKAAQSVASKNTPGRGGSARGGR